MNVRYERSDRCRALLRQAFVLAQPYHAVITNPPYLNKYSPLLKAYIRTHYPDCKADLFAVFMRRNFQFCRPGGYCAFLTPFVWMFIKSYEPLRRFLIEKKHILTLIQLEYSAFEEATVPLCAFVVRNALPQGKGHYLRLTNFKGGMEQQRDRVLEAQRSTQCSYRYWTDQSDFLSIPGVLIAYWASLALLSAFSDASRLGELAAPRQGLATSDNGRFVRMWYEVDRNQIGFGMKSRKEALLSRCKWFPYNKGGPYRKWYGNDLYVVNWENDGQEIRNACDQTGKLRSRPQNMQYYFRQCFSWSLVSSAEAAFRYKPEGFVFDVAGMSCFSEDDLLYLLALCNSQAGCEMLSILAPTINYQCGDIANIPVVFSPKHRNRVEELARECIALSKEDWDSFETSWNFTQHPLLRQEARGLLSKAYRGYQQECDRRYERMLACETELNRIFAQLYGLPGADTPEVKISVHRIVDVPDERQRQNAYVLSGRDVMASFVSYIIGGMLGRYALCVHSRKDGILNMEEAVEGIAAFVIETYGEENKAENLRFIAKMLGGIESDPLETLRQYLRREFYPNHVKRYHKRPVYWQFSSGRRGAFSCLAYIHRFSAQTLPAIAELVIREMDKKEQSAGALEELARYRELLAQYAAEEIKLDDGVKLNYARFEKLLTRIRW